jgi:hypothetical protein
MGYVHDTSMSQFIPPVLIEKSAGTWTATLASNAFYHRRTAADAAFNLFVPIRLPSNSASLKGAYLKSIELIFNITSAAMDDIATVALKKLAFDSAGASTGSDVTVTIDAANDTAAERKATGTHRMTVTLSTPVWVDNDHAYVLYMLVDGSSSGVFDLYGAICNYTLRL